MRSNRGFHAELGGSQAMHMIPFSMTGNRDIIDGPSTIGGDLRGYCRAAS